MHTAEVAATIDLLPPMKAGDSVTSGVPGSFHHISSTGDIV